MLHSSTILPLINPFYSYSLPSTIQKGPLAVTDEKWAPVNHLVGVSLPGKNVVRETGHPLEGVSLPRKSVVGGTGHPDMNISWMLNKNTTTFALQKLQL